MSILAIYFIASIFLPQEHLDNIFVKLDLNPNGRNVPCASIFVHYLIKELPEEALNTKSMEIVDLIGHCNDCSLDMVEPLLTFDKHDTSYVVEPLLTFDKQCINYRLLGFRLCESASPVDMVRVVNHVFQVSKSHDDFNYQN